MRYVVKSCLSNTVIVISYFIVFEILIYFILCYFIYFSIRFFFVCVVFLFLFLFLIFLFFFWCPCCCLVFGIFGVYDENVGFVEIRSYNVDTV